MNVKFTIDPNRSIYAVEKTSIGENTLLRWKTMGHSQYLILFGERRDMVDLSDERGRQKTVDLLSGQGERLLEARTLVRKEDNLYAYLLSHDELKRDGGISIKDIPGVYAVYGVEFSGTGMCVYLGDGSSAQSNIQTAVLDVEIEHRPIYVEKGLFKKTRVYTGYHEIRLKKAQANLDGGALKYRVDDFVFAFPESAVKSGMSFCVRTSENGAITFLSDNPGIRIR